jgi:hypothetical protein
MEAIVALRIGKGRAELKSRPGIFVQRTKKLVITMLWSIPIISNAK